MSDNGQSLPIDDCWNRIGVWRAGGERCARLDEVFHCRNCPTFSQVARRILDRPVDAAYQADWQARLDAPVPKTARDSRSLFVFRIGDQWLGIGTRVVDEVSDIRRFHSIPHAANPVLLGLVNIRGRLKICVSIGRLLNIQRGLQRTGIQRVVVVRDAAHQFAFPVSEARGTLRYRDADLRDPPHALFPTSESLVRGVLTDEGLEIPCLDDALLLQMLARKVR